jgi:predicted acylesterase/phospholipase RssA
MNDSTTYRALVLSGGGARGAYEAGVISALTKSAEFDLVVGTSIGAINAAFVAQAQVEALSQLWHSIGSLGVVEPVPEIGRLKRFLDAFATFSQLPPVAKASHVANLLLLWMQIGSKESLLGLLGVLERDPITAILGRNLNANALKSSLVVTASDLTASTPIAFYGFVGADAGAREAAFRAGAHVETAALSQVDYVAAVEASSAIPGAFSPVQLNLGTASTRLFVDGGVANNTPIGLAIAAGATQVTVVFCDPANQAGVSRISNLIDIGFASFSIMQQKILESDLKLARMTNLAIANAGACPAVTGKRSVQIREIRPSRALVVGTLDFDRQSAIDDAFALGTTDGAAAPPFGA